MKRKIIEIDADRCNGCGICVSACHEGAISLQNGKATLIRDDYCDGLGDCLPVCPLDAIHFIEREALAYDEKAVLTLKRQKEQREAGNLACGCAGVHVKSIERTSTPSTTFHPSTSALRQWPVQIQLVPINAPYFQHCHLLIAADCTAYAYGNFHEHFMKGKITLIGCPKLDNVEYSEKLCAILSQNTILSITVTRMEVPCCGGIQKAVETALHMSKKDIPIHIVTIQSDGTIKL